MYLTDYKFSCGAKSELKLQSFIWYTGYNGYALMGTMLTTEFTLFIKCCYHVKISIILQQNSINEDKILK